MANDSRGQLPFGINGRTCSLEIGELELHQPRYARSAFEPRGRVARSEHGCEGRAGPREDKHRFSAPSRKRNEGWVLHQRPDPAMRAGRQHYRRSPRGLPRVDRNRAASRGPAHHRTRDRVLVWVRSRAAGGRGNRSYAPCLQFCPRRMWARERDVEFGRKWRGVVGSASDREGRTS